MKFRTVKVTIVRGGTYPGDIEDYGPSVHIGDGVHICKYREDAPVLPEHETPTAADLEKIAPRREAIAAPEFIALFSFQQWTDAEGIAGHSALASYPGEIKITDLVGFIDACKTANILTAKQAKRFKRGMRT